jgi:hypothetical protein
MEQSNTFTMEQSNTFRMQLSFNKGQPSRANIRSFDLFALFRQLFIDRNTIRESLLKEARELKQKDKNVQLISDEDINAIKSLWTLLKSSYNYNWLDSIVIPWQQKINHEKLSRIYKKNPLAILLHSDHYAKKNQEKMDEVFKHMGDTSRPTKPTDGITAFATEMTIYLSQTAVDNFIAKNIFRNLDLAKYDRVIEEVNKAVKHHELAIKATEKRIIKKTNLAHEVLKNLSKQHNSSKN